MNPEDRSAGYRVARLTNGNGKRRTDHMVLISMLAPGSEFVGMERRPFVGESDERVDQLRVWIGRPGCHRLDQRGDDRISALLSAVEQD